MRIRPAYVVIVVVAAIGAFVLYAALSSRGGPDQGLGTPSSQSSGGAMLPPVDVNQDLVPVLDIGMDTFDAGLLPNDTITTKTIPVKNTGRKKLVIRQITTTCACTTGKITPMEIMPGATATMEITIEPDRILGFYSEKLLTILSNAPASPMKELVVKAHIEPEFEVEPEVLEFGEVPKGAPAQRQAVLRQVGEEPIELLGVEPIDKKDKSCSFTFAKRPEAEWRTPGKPEYLITAALEPIAPIGKYSKSFVIETTCRRVGRYRLQLDATVTGFYKLNEKEIAFTWNRARPLDGPVGALLVAADRPVEIVDARVSGELFIVKTAPGPRPNTVAIELYINGAPDAGRRDEELTFAVKGEDGALLPNVVPVRGTIIDAK